jgi:flagellar protein FlbD
MIRLTRLNNRTLVVNSELIKFIENAPDTVITLVTGEKIVVLESAEEVMNKVLQYRRELRRVSAAKPLSSDGLDTPVYPEYPWDADAPQEPEDSYEIDG